MSGARGRVVSPELVGRDDELARLVAVVSTSPAVAVIEGEAGIGKTRLVAELATRSTGQVFVTGSCRQIHEPFPLGPVLEALRDVSTNLRKTSLSPVAGAVRPFLPELATVLPALPEPLDDRGAETHRLFRGLAEILAALGPAVLALEDLHWADAQTLEFIDYLASVRPAALSVVLTYRREDASPRLMAAAGRWSGGPGQLVLRLTPLDAVATATLAATMLDAAEVSAEFGRYLCERTSGLPFAIEELLALLQARGSLVRRAGGWERRTLDELDVPARIRDAVLERLGRLSPAARGVADAAAVLQVPVAEQVLTATTRLDPTEAVNGLIEALGSGLLGEQRDARIGFRHQLAAQAVYEDLAGPARRALHDRAADALAALAPPPLGQLAHHLHEAGRRDEWVIAAEQAADQAVALRHDVEAARLYEQVLRETKGDAVLRGRLAVKLGQAAVEMLHVAPTVAALLTEVLEDELPPVVRGELRLRLGLLAHVSDDSDPARASALYLAAIDDLAERPDLQAWAMVGLGLPAPGDDPAERRGWLERALVTLERVTDPDFPVFLLGKIAMVMLALGDPLWRQVTAQMIDRTTPASSHRMVANAYTSVGLEAVYVGHYPDAAALLVEAEQRATAAGSPQLGLRVRAAGAVLDYYRGRWDGLGERLRALTDELHESPNFGIDVQAVAACLEAVTGGTQDALDRLAAVLVDAEQRHVVDLLGRPTAVLVRSALDRQAVTTATRLADHLIDLYSSHELWSLLPDALPALVQALAADARTDDAAELVDRCEQEFERLDLPLASAALVRARAELTGSVSFLLEAAEGYARRSAPYDEALAREALAAVQLESGEPGGAENLLAALSCYRELGTRRDDDRATTLARKHGVAVPGRHRGGRRGYGAALSPREQQVAELAATGRTNKEIGAELFLSHKTVDKHLRSALAKLGLRSRTALAHRLTEAGP
ncbi:helix-turn-helix transcriptional regulator [Kribbella amoyensis]|nr:LuxR family transcriptional regulator [Kribbella amoyensis]